MLRQTPNSALLMYISSILFASPVVCFLKADYAVYRCVIPRAQFRVSSISKASFSSHDRSLCCGPSDVYAETRCVTSVPSAFSQSGRAQNSRFSRFWSGHNSELRPWSLCLPVFEGSCFYWNGVYMVSRDVPVSLLSVMACCRTCNNVYSGGQCFHVHSLFVLHLRE